MNSYGIFVQTHDVNRSFAWRFSRKSLTWMEWPLCKFTSLFKSQIEISASQSKSFLWKRSRESWVKNKMSQSHKRAASVQKLTCAGGSLSLCGEALGSLCNTPRRSLSAVSTEPCPVQSWRRTDCRAKHTTDRLILIFSYLLFDFDKLIMITHDLWLIYTLN